MCQQRRQSSDALTELLKGKTTALQFIYTGCSSVCPMQGALYARVQATLVDQLARNIQLLSVSIDPLGDDAKALSAWLSRFEARPGWIAATLAADVVDRMTSVLRTRVKPLDKHTGQIYLINRNAELIYRTSDLPTAPEMVNLLHQIT